MEKNLKQEMVKSGDDILAELMSDKDKLVIVINNRDIAIAALTLEEIQLE